VLGFAFALEIELDVVEGRANLLEGRLGVEVGVAGGKELADSGIE